MLNSTIDSRSCVREIDSGDGIRSITRTNGFIREHRFLRQMSQIGGMSANNRRIFRQSQRHMHVVINYDWVKP